MGAFAVLKWFRRKPKADPTPDPAEELRAKLQESRTVAEEQHETADEGETTVDAAPDPESRRRDVHEQARKRLDELRGE